MPTFAAIRGGFGRGWVRAETAAALEAHAQRARDGALAAAGAGRGGSVVRKLLLFLAVAALVAGTGASAHVLRLTATQAETSLMPNSAASRR
jgi:hypothetical protein